MNDWVKHFLIKYHLYEFVVTFYHNIKTFKYVRFWDEIKFRLQGSPDQFPFPSNKLIFKIIGHNWRSIYYTSGAIITDNMLTNLKDANIHPAQFSSILDFGFAILSI